jgi:hypothetical protein
VAELADAAGLKLAGPKGPSGFDSRPGHHIHTNTHEMGMMNGIPVVTGSRPCCFWGPALHRENSLFLESLDPQYFRFVALSHAEQLDESADQQLERADRLRAAIALRNAHGQAVETLLALLGAVAQAPKFPLGWLLRYQVADLHEVIEAIDRGRPFLTLLKKTPVTWKTLSELIHANVPESVRRERNIMERFAQLWGRLARQFLAEDFRGEFNSIKHGLRVTPGGFSVAVGVESTPGEQPPPERMRSLGGCEFGSSFFTLSKIDGDEKHHFTLAHVSRNWRPEALTIDLNLVAQSIANVISFLRIVSGADPTTVRFEWPSDDEIFDRHREFLVSVETMKTGPRLQLADIKPVGRKEILALYSEGGAGEGQADEPSVG